MLAAITLTAPLGAQQTDAPEAHWQALAQRDAAAGSSAGNPADSAQRTTPDTTQPAKANDPAVAGESAAQSQSGKDAQNTEEKNQGQEHHRRLLGLVVPAHNVVNDPTAPPLSVHQKFAIFYRGTYASNQWAAVAVSAGISQADDDLSGYGQGMQGYGKRFGAYLADANAATFFGKSLLPSMLHDDPRYFRMGPGEGFSRRLVHAVLSPEWTRRDNGSYRVNYSNLLGNLFGASFSNLYYPDTDRSAGDTFARAGTITASNSLNGIFHEFWPDIQNKLFKKNKPKEAK